MADPASTWERKPYTGTCDACRTYSDTVQDLGEEWAAAARADQPPLSDQIRRALASYGEHCMTAHLGPQETPTADFPTTPDLKPVPSDGVHRCGWCPSRDLHDPCGEPAAWHIAWVFAPIPKGSFVCDPHMAEVRRLFAFSDHHPVAADCDMPGALWYSGRPGYCKVLFADDPDARRRAHVDTHPPDLRQEATDG